MPLEIAFCILKGYMQISSPTPRSVITNPPLQRLKAHEPKQSMSSPMSKSEKLSKYLLL